MCLIGYTQKSRTTIMKKTYLYSAAGCAVVTIGIICFYLFASISKGNDTAYLYIDDDDNMDSITVKLNGIASQHGVTAFRTLARHTGFVNKIRTGRYALEDGMGALSFFRNVRNGRQSAVKLVVKGVRTKDRLADELASKLMIDADALYHSLCDSAICAKFGYDTATIVCMFIPNTYEVYWDVSQEKFLDRMKSESDRFWNDERLSKAEDLNLSPVEVITLASIIDEETANDGEKPMVAGMYYNRLTQKMPLQADPTIKFALQQFELKRIYTKLLSVDSPYNTYRNQGLPPGPIRIPSVAGIDAVLNLVHHDYLYMCAKEDFSGTHNFAKTYAEHLQNAARYSAALDRNNIK